MSLGDIVLGPVQLGDILIRHGIYQSQVVTVTRLTKTQIVIGDSKFRKMDGRMVGSSQWCKDYLAYPKPGEIDAIRYKEAHRTLACRVCEACQINMLKKVSLEDLQRIADILAGQPG